MNQLSSEFVVIISKYANGINVQIDGWIIVIMC